MPPPLTPGLWYTSESASSSIAQVARIGSGTIEPVLRFRRGAMNAKRMHVDLVLLGGERSVEVSFHPAATVDFLAGQAHRRGFDPNGWTGALLRALLADGDRWGSWTPVAGSTASGSLPVLTVLGGLTHPLLGSAYDAGVAAAPEIPRWASPALAESSMAACAVRLFGPGAATRSVVRALAHLLLRPVVAWWQLAACTAAAQVFGPDDLALVLAASDGTAGVAADGADGDGSRLATAEDVVVLRTGLALLEPARAKRLALDTLTTAGEGGVRRLTTALQLLVDVREDVRWPPPVRLADFEAVCLRAAAVDPAPPAEPREPVATPLPPPPPTPPPPTRPAPMRPAWATPRAAPEARELTGSRHDAFSYDAVALSVDRQMIGELELVLPRTPVELTTWGRLLGNCLADFSAAVAARRSTIVGVRQRGALVAALELRSGERRVVQFLGVSNRVPSPRLTTVVLAHLEERGLVRPAAIPAAGSR